MLKRSNDKANISLYLALIGGIAVLPGLFFVALPTPELLMWVGISVTIHCVYQYRLVHAYDRAPLSIVYPTARGLGPLIVALAGSFFLGDTLPITGYVGVGLISLGIFLLAKTDNQRHEGKWFASAVGTAVVIGLLIGSYTLTDTKGMRIAADLFGFIVWHNLIYALVFPVFLRNTANIKLIPALKAITGTGIFIGIIANLGYALALLAFRLGNVVELAALRELSIVVALLLGLIFLKEKINLRRILSATIIAGGVIVLKVI